MKQKLLAFFTAAFILAACNNDKKSDATKEDKAPKQPLTQRKRKNEPMAMPDSATMMKNWQEYMTSSDVHKMMAKWDGTWDGDVTMWMALVRQSRKVNLPL